MGVFLEPIAHITLPETNIFAPKNGWLEYKPFLLGRPIFRGYVSFREGKLDNTVESEQYQVAQVEQSLVNQVSF